MFDKISSDNLFNEVNQDNDGLISPEMVLESLKNKYGDNISISKIDFIDDSRRKLWYVGFSQVHGVRHK